MSIDHNSQTRYGKLPWAISRSAGVALFYFPEIHRDTLSAISIVKDDVVVECLDVVRDVERLIKEGEFRTLWLAALNYWIQFSVPRPDNCEDLVLPRFNATGAFANEFRRTGFDYVMILADAGVPEALCVEIKRMSYIDGIVPDIYIQGYGTFDDTEMPNPCSVSLGGQTLACTSSEPLNAVRVMGTRENGSVSAILTDEVDMAEFRSVVIKGNVMRPKSSFVYPATVTIRRQKNGHLTYSESIGSSKSFSKFCPTSGYWDGTLVICGKKILTTRGEDHFRRTADWIWVSPSERPEKTKNYIAYDLKCTKYEKMHVTLAVWPGHDILEHQLERMRTLVIPPKSIMFDSASIHQYTKSGKVRFDVLLLPSGADCALIEMTRTHMIEECLALEVFPNDEDSLKKEMEAFLRHPRPDGHVEHGYVSRSPHATVGRYSNLEDAVLHLTNLMKELPKAYKCHGVFTN
jgi:hypothetical protein